MQQVITKEQLWERLNQLDTFQQQAVAALIDSLLNLKTPVSKRDKSRLLSLSVWTDEDIAQIQGAQNGINA